MAFETLTNMNAGTSKYALWIIRVVGDPKVIEYDFTARGETVHAQKFECVIVSKDPADYMLGVVPFNFNDRSAATKAKGKFLKDTVWEIKLPAFDSKAKKEYISTPVKRVLLLIDPTKVRAVAPTETDKVNHPARYISPSTKLAEALGLLKTVAFGASAGPVSGSPAPPGGSQAIDLCLQLLSLTSPKRVERNGKTLDVVEMEGTDDSMSDGRQSLGKLSLWDGAHAFLKGIPVNTGVTLVGCTAIKEDGKVKLNVWKNSVHVLLGGERAQTLSGLAPRDASELSQVTATFTPTHAPISTEGEAVPTSCAALALAAQKSTALAITDDKLFQTNRCHFEPPTMRDNIFTRGGEKLFVQAILRDRTGPCEVAVVEAAAPFLYNLADKGAIEKALKSDTLSPQGRRVNVRGVLRSENGAVKIYIAEITISPLKTLATPNALRNTLGLAAITGDIVLPAPADRISQCPILGLALRKDSGDKIAAHRVLLLVVGTCDSKLEPLASEDGQPLSAAKFIVGSSSVQCLLSQPPVFVDLHGYCDFGGTLQYRLDTEFALVLISSVSASGSERPVLTVEHMQKVNSEEKDALLKSLAVEWTSVLSSSSESGSADQLSPAEIKYWEEPRQKMRRIASEAHSPQPRGPGKVPVADSIKQRR